MSKCLVTKLKASVDNPGLPFFGEMQFNVDTQNSPEGQMLRFETDGTDVVVNTAGHVRPDETHLDKGTYTVKVYPKYNLTKLVVGKGIGFNWDDLKLLSSMKNLMIYNNANVKSTDSIEVFAAIPDIEQITIIIDLIGNFEALKDLKELRVADFVFGPNVTGSIEVALANMVHLTTTQFASSTGITGTLEKVFESWVEKGKTDICNVRGSGSNNITFHGEAVPMSDTDITYFLPAAIGCKIARGNYSNIIATYNKSTKQWSYN